LYDVMAWLEESALGLAMRETGVWTYAIVNLTHIFGIALLFGAIFVLDLRLMGVWRGLSLADLAKPAVAVARGGFAVAAVTGIGLLATKTTEYYGNPFLVIKFGAIGLGLVNLILLHRLPAWRARANAQMAAQDRNRLALAGAVSLVCWVGAVSAGRMIAYW
jgi:hypothetical protein